MKVRFLADADLNLAIVTGVLREQPAVDFESAKHAGLRGLVDQDVLALAAERGRILVSHDVNTMPAHFAAFVNSVARSPGVFLIHQRMDVGAAVEELLLVWHGVTSGGMGRAPGLAAAIVGKQSVTSARPKSR